MIQAIKSMRNSLFVGMAPIFSALILFGNLSANAATTRRALPPDLNDSEPPQTSYHSYGSGGVDSSQLGSPKTIAGSAMMVDADSGEVLLSKNPDLHRPIASTQKLLTALIIVSHGGLDDRVKVAAADCHVEPTKLGFKPGDVYTKRQLLGPLLIHSCNDAALCLARNDAGSIAAFADEMNAKARALGATHSHFVNPNGLPIPGQYSTARDLSRIALVAYQNPILRQYMRMQGFNFTFCSGRTRHFDATNKLIARSTMFTGMKTGYTEASGRCLVSSISSEGRHVILVQLGGTHGFLFNDAERLLLWAVARHSGTLSAE